MAGAAGPAAPREMREQQTGIVGPCANLCVRGFLFAKNAFAEWKGYRVLLFNAGPGDFLLIYRLIKSSPWRPLLLPRCLLNPRVCVPEGAPSEPFALSSHTHLHKRFLTPLQKQRLNSGNYTDRQTELELVEYFAFLFSSAADAASVWSGAAVQRAGSPVNCSLSVFWIMYKGNCLLSFVGCFMLTPGIS